MTKRMPNLQPLGGDRWRYRMFIGRRPDGSQRTRSKTFRAATEKAAEKTAHTIAVALEAERNQQLEARGTIAELAKDWMELKRRQGRSPATLQGYSGIVTRIVGRFGTKQVADITGRDIDRWYGELAEPKRKGVEPMTAATVQHHHAVLRAMLRQGERWDLVASVATRRASPPTAPRHEINPPTDAALAVLMADTRGDFANVVRVLAGTGLRRGELVGLAWSDLVGDQLTVRRSVLELPKQGLVVKTTKGRKPRTITVGPDVLDAFAAQRAHLQAMADALEVGLPADGPVFADLKRDPKGLTPRRPWWVSNEWIKLRDKHGMDVRLHDIRHWNATKMVDMGVSSATGAYRLGHAQVQTFNNIYLHAVASSEREAAGLLSDALAVPPQGLEP